MPHFTAPDGCRLFYETHGLHDHAPVVVFANGLTQTTLNWRPHALRLRDRFTVVAYDARGQGRSGLGRSTLSLPQHAQDLSALLDHLAVRRCCLVGMSLGARVALASAGRSPERFSRLVVCSAAARPVEPGASMVRSWRETLRLGGLEAMAWAMAPVVFGKTFLNRHARMLEKIVQALVLRNRPEALEAQLKALESYPANIELAEKIRTPVLILSGAEDLLVSPDSARQLADACGGRQRLLEGVGHSLPAEVPEVFGRVLYDFLAVAPPAANPAG